MASLFALKRYALVESTCVAQLQSPHSMLAVPSLAVQLRLAILETQDKASAVQQAESSGAALAVVEERFMELLASCEESLRRAVADVARLSKAGRKAQTAEAHELEAYIRRMKLQAAVRGWLIVRDHARSTHTQNVLCASTTATCCWCARRWQEPPLARWASRWLTTRRLKSWPHCTRARCERWQTWRPCPAWMRTQRSRRCCLRGGTSLRRSAIGIAPLCTSTRPRYAPRAPCSSL